MKILLLGGYIPEGALLYGISGCPKVYHYFLRREFRRLGHETISHPIQTYTLDRKTSEQLYADIPPADHALSVEQKAFALRHNSFNQAVRAKVRGCVATICDNNLTMGPEDVTFFAIPGPINKVGKAIYVGWAADASLLEPNQPFGRCNILIDHTEYGQASDPRERSVAIARAALQFAAERGSHISVRRFVSGEIETVTQAEVERYDQRGVSWARAAEEYRRTHIFCVTHAESMGLSVLEAAMAGALILTPRNYIKRSLLDSLYHLEYSPDEPVPFAKAYEMWDGYKARSMAMQFDNWNGIARKMVQTFESYE